MHINGPVLAAICGLLGVALGATLNHFFATAQQEQSKLLELRSSAYLLFMHGQAALQEAGQQTDPEQAAALMQDYRKSVKEARFQIGILGSGAQVSALTEYFLLHPPAAICDPTWEVDVEIYKAMRADLLSTKEAARVDDARLYYLLWDCLPPALAARGKQ